MVDLDLMVWTKYAAKETTKNPYNNKQNILSISSSVQMKIKHATKSMYFVHATTLVA